MKVDKEKLNVGDTVFVSKQVPVGYNTYFRYHIIREERITRITPKRTKIETDKGIYEYSAPFVIPDEKDIRENNIARALLSISSTLKLLNKQNISLYTDDEIMSMYEIAKQLKEIIDTHNAK